MRRATSGELLVTHHSSLAILCYTSGNVTYAGAVEEGLLDSITLARQILEIVEEKQASNIVLLDVHEQTTLADYFLLATVDTLRQAKAIEDDMLEKLRLQQNIRPLTMDGVDTGGGGWQVLDYGDVIVHLFTEEMRDFYNLEQLWSKASVVAKVI
jgi:ribosome-associated protein